MKDFPRTFRFVHDIFRQTENIVENPVQNKSARRIVQQNKENERDYVQLHFLHERRTLCINRPGDKIDERHQNRKQMKRPPCHFDKAIRFSEIAENPKTRSPQNLAFAQKMIGGNEERNFKQNGKGTAQSIKWMVIVLSIILRKHHKALIATERLFYPPYSVFKFFRHFPFAS